MTHSVVVLAVVEQRLQSFRQFMCWAYSDEENHNVKDCQLS